jgi:hypothetical protein
VAEWVHFAGERIEASTAVCSLHDSRSSHPVMAVTIMFISSWLDLAEV